MALLWFSEMLLKLCAVTYSCQLLPGVLSPARTFGSWSHGSALQGKGQYSVLKSSPVKPRLGPKLLSVQAGGGALDIFGMPASLGLCRHRMCIYTHTPPHFVPQLGGKGTIDAKHLCSRRS